MTETRRDHEHRHKQENRDMTRNPRLAGEYRHGGHWPVRRTPARVTNIGMANIGMAGEPPRIRRALE